jgi:replicative DNA helicase
MVSEPGSPVTPHKLLPQNIEAEEAVLGALLIDPDAIIRVATFLQAGDFHVQRHGMVYQAILDLHERREPADLVTLTDELERREQLGEVGGPAFLTGLINATPTSIHVEYYARIVERTAVLRRLIDAAGQIAKLAYQDVDDVDEVVDRAESIIFGVSEKRVSRDLVPIRQALDDFYDRIEYLREHQGEIIGIPTGLADLDKLLGGFQRSDLVIIAGRPGMGKTSLALSIALQAARRWNKRIGIFSMEMSNEQVVQRLVSAETGIDSQRLRLGAIHDDEWPTFFQATSLLSTTQIFIDDTPAISALEMRTKARRLYAEHGLDMIIVDYLQLMRGDLRSENRVQEISFISRSLKALARELNIPVVALSQLSRAVEARADRRPMLSDLRESGCLTGDTLVYVPNQGTYVPIGDLAGKSGFEVMSLDPQTLKLVPSVASRAFCTGVKPVYRLTTRLGRSVRATANHKFLTVRGWKRLDELSPNERIALPRTLTGPALQSMSDAELALLGHLIGDGCTLPRHAVQYTTRERDLADTVAALAVTVFGDQVEPRVRQERAWYQVYLAATRHLTYDTRNPVAEWLDNLGVFGLRSYEKRIPSKVFEQPPAGIAFFLRHLWSTDGCIHLSHGTRHYANVYYASSSERLAQDVQSLLLRLGINARLARHSQNGKGRDQYHVTVSGKPDLESFIDVIGTVGQYKGGHLAAIRQYVSDRQANTNRDAIPRDVWQMYAVPAMQREGITTRRLHADLGNAYCGTALYKQNISRERAARLAKVVRSDEIACLAESNVYWDEVISIEADGTEEVFDLTVPGLHNFIAGDIIVHNSIEQDADVVVFVYRDDVYDPDTEFPNIAELRVAKHRSGPTGIFSVYFKKELAQFVDLEVRRESLDY